MSWAVLSAILIVSSFHLRAGAQVSTAVCLPGFEWTFNSHQQSPCLMSAYLLGNCRGGQFTVGPLAPDEYYIGPTADIQNQCWCSSVVYSLVSACGDCQNRTWISWSTWDKNCSLIYPQVYPMDIPHGTSVPAWAYLNVAGSDSWVPSSVNASIASGAPESTATGAQSTFNPSATGTSTPTATRAPKKSNTGVIVGATVGGVVVVGIIAALIAFFVMRNKQRPKGPTSVTTASSQAAFMGGGFTSPPTSPPPMNQRASQYDQYHVNPFTVSQATQPRLYDPSDPSTYPSPVTSALPVPPVSPPPSNWNPSYPAINNPSSAINTDPNYQQPLRPNYHPGQQYIGRPEV